MDKILGCQTAACPFARFTMQPHPGSRGLEGRRSLRKQRTDDACQNIA